MTTFIVAGVVLAIAVALLVGGLLVVAFFTAAVELVIDDVSITAPDNLLNLRA